MGNWLTFVLVAGVLRALPAPPTFRLPDDVVPLKYRVELTIDPNRDTFEGRVSIDVNVRKKTPVIWLNGKDLILKQTAQMAGGEFIGLERDQPEGVRTISLDYQGHLDDKTTVGAYRRQVEGQWYVYTTFTPIEARRVFPCFDEPRFKTPWEISIRVPRGNRAFSNARQIAEIAEADGSQLIRFAETEPLPTELVAFAVGPFDTRDVLNESGTSMRVITPKGHAAEGAYAGSSAVALLSKLEAYTGIPYSFGKLDHLALADAGFSAVENPGLIVYLAKQLLLPPVLPPGTGDRTKTRAVRFLEAHEMGHQWFGDLVTQADWNDVWLSEGFASWIADKMMDQEESPSRAHLPAVAARERIMMVDASAMTRPVRVEVHSREESLDIYNRMVYDKGASVLLMLEGWLGEEKFREGLGAYLRDHRFGNATSQDLAGALKRTTETDPWPVMHSFLDTTGIPRVQGQVQCDRAARLTIRQTGASAIPVCYRGDGISPACAVLDAPSREIALRSCPSWVYLNSGGTGYYRVAWDTKPLASLPLDQLTPAERLTLVYDLRARKTAAARAVLGKLESDAVPEIAGAAHEALQ